MFPAGVKLTVHGQVQGVIVGAQEPSLVRQCVRTYAHTNYQYLTTYCDYVYM